MKLETETEVRSKNTPAITAYAIGVAKKQQNDEWDYNFK